MKGLLGLLCLLAVGQSVKRQYSLIDTHRQKLFGLEADLDALIFASNWNDVQTNSTYLEIIKAYNDFGDSLDEHFPATAKTHVDSLNSLWLWARVKSEKRTIDGLYMTFRRMQGQVLSGAPFNVQQWTNFAETILHDVSASIPAALDRISNFIVHQKLFVSAYQESSSQICNMQQSPQQLLYSLYTTITLTEIKGYAMMQFSWLLLKMYNKGNFSEEMQLLKNEYMLRTLETLREVKTAMTFAPRALWRCDPSIHEENVTYTELKQLLQGFVVNEVDMNSAQTCRENCGYYTAEKVYSCYQNQYCSRQRRCNGMLYNCQYIDSDMWICPSKRESNRRYEYIEYENGRTLGKKGTCASGTTKVDSWWRWLFWHCSYCICFCDDHNSSSDRYFNLRNVTADIENNMVITGIKFTKKNQIIHLQIQQGLLLPRGGIQSETIGWKPVENYKISDRHVHEGRDYHTLGWSQRALDLDDLDASSTTYHGSKEEHLVTGVRFRLVGKNLNLEILLTPFNFTTGKLIKPLERSLWHGNDNTAASLTNPRTLFKIEKPDVPTHSPAPSVPDSMPDQYLEFAPSDLTKDVAQTTIPFIDIQPIVPHPAVPISGVGIFHKGREGYGGFVAPKLFTFNFSPHLNIEFPPPKPVVSEKTLLEPESM
ncbi:uncharacterized protein LOC107271598 isoform X2 [Cephus cinctus]|uniref:Uncharacterized protein LOC107271598 isoform X2 n=1 Tax=Cephus cinctus TaxID=211228 RepID=A0AAJ7C7H7_CEPCN|nr:uncharacterized protein LOC107271598 isoform X2 [Cephus cinctus]